MSSTEDLYWKIDELRDRIATLEVENRLLRDQRDDAETRIRRELEPRIKADQRAYDRWATSPERN